MEVLHEIMHDLHSTKPSSARSQLAVHFPLKSKKQFNHILSALKNTLHKSHGHKSWTHILNIENKVKVLKKTRTRKMSKRSAANEPHPRHEVHKQNQSGGCQRRQLRGRGGVHLMWAKRPHLRIIVVNSNSPTPKL